MKTFLMEFVIKYFRYHCHLISCIKNYYINICQKWINVTSETMEYYLSNDTRLAPFEPVSKNNMLVYLNVELPNIHIFDNKQLSKFVFPNCIN